MQELQNANTYQVVDADISDITMAEAMAAVKRRAAAGQGGYACFVNAHVSVTTRKDLALRSAVNGATFAFPDGMPVYLVGRHLRRRGVEKVSGPDFMGRIFADEESRKFRHYFYGGKPEVLETLVAVLERRYPDCEIVGAESPPFRVLTEQEQQAVIDRIVEADAQIVWVGLGAPKQELWMQRNSPLLNSAMLMGVGAAFDFHAGVVDRAPEWAQRWGLEWLHRLLQEPRRLWKRYFITNTLFVWFTINDQLARLFRSGDSM